MAKYPYLGPAGIFSTDDPATDQRQIEAEQADWEEGYGEEPWEDDYEREEDYPEVDYPYGICPNKPWYSCEMFFAGDEKDLEKARKALQARHDQECGCGADIWNGQPNDQLQEKPEPDWVTKETLWAICPSNGLWGGQEFYNKDDPQDMEAAKQRLQVQHDVHCNCGKSLWPYNDPEG